jgi:hypothetical protein
MTTTTFAVHTMPANPDVKVSAKRNGATWITIESPGVEITLFFADEWARRLFMQKVAETFLTSLESREIPAPSLDINDSVDGEA